MILTQEQEEDEVRMAFTALDPEEKGFIDAGQVEVLAKNLGKSFLFFFFLKVFSQWCVRYPT